jgi:superfamily II DNA or RNA helicase
LEHDINLQKLVDREVEYRTEKMVRWNKRISHATAKQRSIWLVNHNIGIVENMHRNRIVVDSAKEVLEHHSGASVLVLINHVAHAQKLILMNNGLSEDCLVHGKTPLKQRREKLKEFVDGKRSILLGTASLFGEGFDAPGMTHVINAAGGKSPIAIVQRAGRSSRTSTNKSCGHVIDFSDKHLRTLSNHATERQEIYSSLGYRHA